MIDSHCHLTYISKKSRDLQGVLERANKAGIFYFVDIGVHPNDLDERMFILSDAEGVFFSIGYYPDYANENDEDTIKAFELKIKNLNKKNSKNKNKSVYAIGEIGLDYNHDDSNKNEQKEFFMALCNAAKNVELPILIHSRDAFKDTFKVLKEADIPKRGIFHCFSGNVEDAKNALDLGYILSFSGSATYMKNDFIREAVKYVPKDMFTIETDAPYLTPQKVRGRANEPAFIPYTVEVLAEVRGESSEDIMRTALENAARVLELPIDLNRI